MLAKSKRKHKQRNPRVDATLPVRVEGKPGFTRDVSASGMFLETDAAYRIGRTIDLSLNLDTPWGKVVVNCHGKIVRLEKHDHRIGIAVTFVDAAQSLSPRRRKAARERTAKNEAALRSPKFSRPIQASRADIGASRAPGQGNGDRWGGAAEY
jgi:Tfp pilus assembly protein PilZ